MYPLGLLIVDLETARRRLLYVFEEPGNGSGHTVADPSSRSPSTNQNMSIAVRRLFSGGPNCLQLGPLNSQQSRQYVEHGLRSASIHANAFEPEAMELLIQAGGGLPRTINHLAQRSMEAAAAQSSVDVSAAHVQAGIDRLPWLVNLLQEQSAL